MTTKTQAERIARCEGRGVSMIDALHSLADLCRKAKSVHDEIEALAEACDIGYVPYSTIPGGYYDGVTSNVSDIMAEAERLISSRS